MSEPQFSLSDYLSTVQEVIQITFNEPVWVKAEIRNLNIKGGHYYLELAEKDESTDKVIASCKGTIWKFTAQKMVLKFERESGVELSKDLNVLLKDSIKLLDMSSLKSLTTICVEPSNVFLTGSLYEGKPSVTIDLGVPKVLERLNYVTLVSCQLETGRTHQIRAHMKYIGHPLFNDETYGGDQIIKGTTYSKYKQFVQNCFKLLPRQALHATTLGFIHPTTKENIYFESQLPEDMIMVNEKWEHYINYNRPQEDNTDIETINQSKHEVSNLR